MRLFYNIMILIYLMISYQLLNIFFKDDEFEECQDNNLFLDIELDLPLNDSRNLLPQYLSKMADILFKNLSDLDLPDFSKIADNLFGE